MFSLTLTPRVVLYKDLTAEELQKSSQMSDKRAPAEVAFDDYIVDMEEASVMDEDEYMDDDYMYEDELLDPKGVLASSQTLHFRCLLNLVKNVFINPIPIWKL